MKRTLFTSALALCAAIGLFCPTARAQGLATSGAKTTDAATSATGSAVPTSASYAGVRESSSLAGLIQCDKSAQSAISTATTTQLVALSGSTVIYVCGFTIEIQGVATTAGTAQLKYGTGTACATSPVSITPDFIGSITAGTPTVISQGIGLGTIFRTVAGQALCVTTTTTTVQKVFISYAQF